MILTFDVGNTEFTINGVEGERIHPFARLSLRDYPDNKSEIENILKKIPKLDFEVIIGSSVFPEIDGFLKKEVRNIFKKDLLFLSKDFFCDMKIAIDRVEELGSDIIAGIAAAQDLCTLPFVVIDVGTCTTLFAMNEKSEICGGYIFPGVSTQIDSINEKTSLINVSNISECKDKIPSNTKDAVSNAILYGNAGMVDRLLEEIENHLGNEVDAVLTGGQYEKFSNLIRHKHKDDKHLVSKGLAKLYKVSKSLER